MSRLGRKTPSCLITLAAFTCTELDIDWTLDAPPMES
jgi:hypothetical protein